jgi:hypothetical protein
MYSANPMTLSRLELENADDKSQFRPAQGALSYKVNKSSAPKKVTRGDYGRLEWAEARGIVGAQGPEVPGSWQRPDRLRDDRSRTV